jgi:hypothetical protein
VDVEAAFDHPGTAYVDDGTLWQRPIDVREAFVATFEVLHHDWNLERWRR